MKRGLLELVAAAAAVACLAVGALAPDLGAVSLVAVVPIAWLAISGALLRRGLGRLAGMLERARKDEDAPVAPMGGALAETSRALAAFVDDCRGEARNTRTMAGGLKAQLKATGDLVEALAAGLAEQRTSVRRNNEAIAEMSGSLKDIAVHVETLATSAEESSSSILEMTTTNEEVAENMSSMGNSVRETVSSIGEMAYSVKEVARNIEALSTTAEETSSAVNEMDVTIDQVQSNANDTAIISENVARDAERAADAVVKTLGAIQQIKDTSQEAVNVISSLGQKIEAIGHILNVIDDVAEQTNLLALNAAIIAAQAGEHGKGFAVVADEIKDLAERSGVSTKEIADLIKAIQAESRNAIAAVERGNSNVDKGVEVSADAERALKKILESSQKSTNMMRAIARATVEQSKGSKQVTDTINRIAETVQQIAKATGEQARGSELIIKGAEKMRSITQHVERSTQEQAKGGRQITTAIESISKMVNQLNLAHHQQQQAVERIIDLSSRVERISKEQEDNLRRVRDGFSSIERAIEVAD
ncbi:MAG: methyl-accepting chemotaxis protein [Proteobacteria bacterium]|jgi:methyl-accepting chemotaxis protein|nr:methyl-accepting chemotaxis protein [Pseudomonadota bacterium]